MSLIDRLNNRQNGFEKNADEIFSAAFFDELEKLGYNVDIEKDAGRILSAIGGLLKKTPSPALQVMKTLSKNRKALQKSTSGFINLQKKDIARGMLRQAKGSRGLL